MISSSHAAHRAERRGSALNLAFLAPITPLRTYVLGAEANERAAAAAETKAIAGLLREAMQAGAWGFTTTANRQHIGHGGKPLAARLASREELAAYAGVLKRCERGVIELALTNRYATLAEDEEELLTFLLDASYTYLLGHCVREKGAAIQRITSEPADFFGFKDRGRLRIGAAADIVVFDERTINSPLRPTPVKDLPAGGTRLYCRAEGISEVIVNGEMLYRNGRHTGALPGGVLRSS